MEGELLTPTVLPLHPYQNEDDQVSWETQHFVLPARSGLVRRIIRILVCSLIISPKDEGWSIFETISQSASTVHGAHPGNEAGSVRFVSRKEWDVMSKDSRVATDLFRVQNIVVVGTPAVRSMETVNGWDTRQLGQYVDLEASRDVVGGYLLFIIVLAFEILRRLILLLDFGDLRNLRSGTATVDDFLNERNKDDRDRRYFLEMSSIDVSQTHALSIPIQLSIDYLLTWLHD